MLREFVQLVSEAVDEGHEKGVELFMESLENDLAKDEIFESHSVTEVMAQLFQEAGYDVEVPENAENIDEEKVDAMLNQLEQEGDLD